MIDIAHRIGEKILHNDGGRTTTWRLGVDARSYLRRTASRVEPKGAGTRYVFRDGSAIFVRLNDVWDYQHRYCRCGTCWDGELRCASGPMDVSSLHAILSQARRIVDADVRCQRTGGSAGECIVRVRRDEDGLPRVGEMCETCGMAWAIDMAETVAREQAARKEPN